MQIVNDVDFKLGTAKDCVAICKQRGVAYAAIEDGTKCVCGNVYNNQGEVDRQECIQSADSAEDKAAKKGCRKKQTRRIAVYSVFAEFSDLENPTLHPKE